MPLSNVRTLVLLALLPAAGTAAASGGYIAGVSGEADTSEGRAVSAFVDYGFTDATWLSTTVAKTNTGGVLGGLETLYASASLEHSFGLVGLRAGAAYWGDDDILDSNDLRGSVFFRGKTASLSMDYERRDFDFVFAPLGGQDLVRTAEFSADGIGAAGWIEAGDNASFYANGMSYNYSRDIRLQQSIDNLRLLSTSRLSLMNSLIDYRVSAGMDYRFGSRLVDITFSTWQTALDGGHVNSIGIGFVAPSGPASDLEIRVTWDESKNFGSTYALSVSFYYFGG